MSPTELAATPQRITAGSRRAGPPGEVAHLQRARIKAAAIAVVEECGFANLTVSRIVARSRISRKTFYDLFPHADACFLASVEQTLDEVRELLGSAYHAEPDWRSGLRAGTLALLEAIDGRPALARVCVVEALSAGPAVLERRAHAIRYASAAIERGAEVPGAYRPPPHTAHAIVGGIGELLHAWLLQDDPAPCSDLHGPIMSMIVLPYLGRVAADEELRLCADNARTDSECPGNDIRHTGLVDVKLRLTYRTIRVLLAIAELPGASNREIALHAGIVDPAQMSKLLKRLQNLGLIENLGGAPPRGARNEWRLTSVGSELRRATAREHERPGAVGPTVARTI